MAELQVNPRSAGLHGPSGDSTTLEEFPMERSWKRSWLMAIAIAPLGSAIFASPSPSLADLTQRAYLKASNTDAFDFFGRVVSVSNDTVVVTASGEDSSATGVNGDESDNSSSFAGAVYVFARDGAGWHQEAYLKASNSEAGDSFGISASISGDTVVVGAPGESSNATGVNGNEADNTRPGSGAAYVFVRNGTTWSQQAYLKASNTDTDDSFGSAVAIWGDTIVVGAECEDSNATGVNGNEGNNTFSAAGAAYVFVRNGTTWSQQAYLKASNTGFGDAFGDAVSVWDNTIVVGAKWERSNASGVNGDEADNSLLDAGAAYVFVRNGTSWTQQVYLKASNTDGSDSFGETVSVSEDTIVVGASSEDSNATGVNGNDSDNSSPGSGAAFVFGRNGTNWAQEAYLKSSNSETVDRFGVAVAVSGNTIAVGAIGEDSSATGTNGDQSDNSAPTSGAAYLFKHSGGSWIQRTYIKASVAGDGDFFGTSVALSGGKVVVGANFEDSSATGVNGDENNNGATSSGAAYAFETRPMADRTNRLPTLVTLPVPLPWSSLSGPTQIVLSAR